MAESPTPLSPRDPASFERIEEIIQRIRPDWAAEANVIDIVPAIKVTGGKVQGDVLAIGFHVLEKVPTELLGDRGYRPVPATIEDVPTDVIVARQPALDGHVDTKATRSQMFDTLVGGIALGNANIHAYGTLAMTLLAVSDSRMVALTNEHVLVYDIDGHIGDEVQQPRYYLWSEVSLDSASCCPNGQLHYRPVNNYIVDAAMAVFAACAIAAAASDKIDPHRRGQDATVPAAEEITVRETVSMALDYGEIPLPGTRFKIATDWKYERETDRDTYIHTVTETVANEHVLGFQHLVTDRRSYKRGAVVKLLAWLGTDPEQADCRAYFVTAALLSPSHQKAYKVILRPRQIAGGVTRLAHGQSSHQLAEGAIQRCITYAQQKPGDKFTSVRVIDAFTYDPSGYTCQFTATGPGSTVGLRFPDHGVSIGLPQAATSVTVSVLVFGGPMKLTAYFGTQLVGSATADHASTPQQLQVTGASIDRIVLSGGSSEAILLELCLKQMAGEGCAYFGEIQLDANEELGVWKTYLMAQTLNDVSVGTDPVAAAPTIGAIPVTRNFVDAGGSDNITYGHSCNVDQASDGDFEVVV
jgi:hypothetical protein